MMRSFKLKFLLLWMCAFFIMKQASSHKFYTSISKMEYNDKTHSWEIIMNVFYDDWEKTLSEFHMKKVSVNDKDIEALTFNYLKNVFQIKSGDQLLALKFVGAKQENDVFKIYFECPQKKLSKNIQLSNVAMLESIEEQINIVNIRINEKTQTAVFQKGQKLREIKL